MRPLFYQRHLQQHLTRAQFLVLGILLNPLQSSRQVKLEQLASAFPYPITTPLSAWEITEVLEFASTNNQSDLVSLHHLLVNYLLPSGSDFINCDRTWRGLYQYTLGLPGVGEESYPFILVTVT
jgi:hypothetical protein